jgi:hypothetical protein
MVGTTLQWCRGGMFFSVACFTHRGSSSNHGRKETGNYARAREPVTNPLTWRQFALVTLVAGFGSVILLELTYRLIIIPLRPSPTTVGLIGVAVLYLAIVPFGFLVGYLWPSRHLRVCVPLGLAVGLAELLGDTAWFVAYGLSASWSWLTIYGVAPALIFFSATIVGNLVKKGQLSLNAAALTSAVALLSAIVGLITAIATLMGQGSLG